MKHNTRYLKFEIIPSINLESVQAKMYSDDV